MRLSGAGATVHQSQQPAQYTNNSRFGAYSFLTCRRHNAKTTDNKLYLEKTVDDRITLLKPQESHFRTRDACRCTGFWLAERRRTAVAQFAAYRIPAAHTPLAIRWASVHGSCTGCESCERGTLYCQRGSGSYQPRGQDPRVCNDHSWADG